MSQNAEHSENAVLLPPYLWEIRSKTLTGCLKPWIVPKTIHIMLFSIRADLLKVEFITLGTVRDEQ